MVKIDLKVISSYLIRHLQKSKLKKETGDRRQETGGKLHGDSNPK
ncbi:MULTISPECIES: hypothetical protein [Okeania]|nr:MULTISPECIES: hypothetical protein [Okeania]